MQIYLSKLNSIKSQRGQWVNLLALKSLCSTDVEVIMTNVVHIAGQAWLFQRFEEVFHYDWWAPPTEFSWDCIFADGACIPEGLP